ncbi:unnamed protein product, partial [Closterium sp. NIES-64]
MASSRPLDRIGLPQPLINRFFARGLTTAQVRRQSGLKGRYCRKGGGGKDNRVGIPGDEQGNEQVKA